MVYGPHELSHHRRSRGYERHNPREYNRHGLPYEYSQEDLDYYYQNRDAGQYTHGTQGGDTYYIIPGGTNVIFQDEDGNEITRSVILLRSTTLTDHQLVLATLVVGNPVEDPAGIGPALTDGRMKAAGISICRLFMQMLRYIIFLSRV